MWIGRLPAFGDEAVNVAHHVRKRIGPGFLVAARQVCVLACDRIDERWILLQDFVRSLSMANQQFVLMFLAPLERGLRSADFNFQIVLVPRAHLTNREASLGAVVESKEDRCQVLDLDVNFLDLLVRVRRGKRLTGSERPLSLWNHGRDVAEHVRNPQTAHVLGKIAPVRPNVAQGRRSAPFVGLQAPRIVRILEEPILKI
jgi:hypothetical protein